MKKWLLILLAAVMLTGCARDTQTETEPSTQPETVPTEPPKPLELYVPESQTELDSQGALQVYATQWEQYEILPLEDGVLLFAGEGSQTHLYLLTGKTLLCAAELVVEGVTTPAQWTVGNGFARYDRENRSFLVYDRQLRETQTVKLPAQKVENALISRDFSAVYYSTGTDLMVYDVAKKVPRPLRVGGEFTKKPVQLIENDTLLIYEDISGERQDFCLMDASTGQMVRNMVKTQVRYAGAQMYYLQPEKNQLQFAKYGQKKTQLLLGETAQITHVLPDTGKILALDGTVLSVYDSASGKKTAEIALPEATQIRSATFREDGNVWVVCEDQLLLWQTELSAVSERTVYTKKMK